MGIHIGVLLLLLAVGAWLAADLQRGRQQTLDEVGRQALQKSQIVSQSFAAQLQAADYVLRDVLGHVGAADLVHPDPDAAHAQRLTALLKAKADTLPGVVFLVLYDRDCVFTATQAGRHAGHRSDAALCEARRRHRGPGAHVQLVQAPVAAAGQPVIVLTRPLFSAAQEFQGGIMAVIELAEAQRWLETFATDSADSMALVDSADILVARTPPLPGAAGHRVPSAELHAATAAGARQTVMLARSALDGRERLYAVSAAEGFPFRVVIGFDKAKVLEEWQRRAVQLLGGYGLLLALSLMVAWSHWSALRQREALADNRRFVQAVLDSVPSHIAVVDEAGVIVATNEPWRQFARDNSGTPDRAAARTDVGSSYLAACRASANAEPAETDDAARARQGLLAVLEHRLPRFSLQYPCHAPGTPRWFLMTAVPLAAGARGAVVLHQDITALIAAEEQLRLAASVFSHAYEGILLTTPDGAIVDVNEAFCRITGYTREEVLGRKPSLLRSGRHDAAFYQALWAQLDSQGYWKGELWNRRKNGQEYPQSLSIQPVRGPRGEVRHYVALFSDITERKALEEEIRRLAFHDPLTDLPNRRLLVDRLQVAIASARRTGDHGALMFIDLDRFKFVNDHYGHEAGDALLVAVARRLQSGLRAADTVARFGGDEFVLLFAALGRDATQARQTAEQLAHKVLQALRAPHTLTDQSGVARQHLSPGSIGVVMFDGEAAPGVVMQRADQAMYQAKEAGRDTCRVVG